MIPLPPFFLLNTAAWCLYGIMNDVVSWQRNTTATILGFSRMETKSGKENSDMDLKSNLLCCEC